MRFEGRKILVTGGAAGIGLAFTQQLVSQGASVIAVARNAERLKALADANPGRVVTHIVDLADRHQVAALIEKVVKEHPDLSVLINNAAGHGFIDFTMPANTATTNAIYSEVDTNFSALAHLCHGLMPVLSAQSSAMIINISSGLALSPKRSAPIYCATKAAVRSFSKALRYQCERDLPQAKIIDAVMALVDTDMTAGRGRGKISPDAAAAEVLAGAAKGKYVIWVGKAKLLRIIHRLAPSLADRILRDG